MYFLREGALVDAGCVGSVLSVFPSEFVMDYIFEFAKIDSVFAKLRLFYDKIGPTVTGFSYVNRNAKYKEARYRIRYSCYDLHRKFIRHCGHILS